MAFPKHMRAAERPIIEALIRRVLDKGYTISVFDGNVCALGKSKDFEAITAEVNATDITEFLIRDSDARKIGWVIFIHGNDEDVIHDHTDNPEMEELVGS